MTRWLHLQCALGGAQGGVQRISQLEGWDRMGYDASKVRVIAGSTLLRPGYAYALTHRPGSPFCCLMAARLLFTFARPARALRLTGGARGNW